LVKMLILGAHVTNRYQIWHVRVKTMMFAYMPNLIWNGLFCCPRGAKNLPEHHYVDSISLLWSVCNDVCVCVCGAWCNVHTHNRLTAVGPGLAG